MSDRVWIRIGQIGTAVAAVAAVITVIVLLRSPSNTLVADIYPMGFALPISYKDIDSQIKPGPIHDNLAALVSSFSRAKGLVKINLHNAGELQVTDIRVKITDAVLYAKSTNSLDDAEIIPFDNNGVKLSEMRQGDSITIYSWTKTPLELYQFWGELRDKFQITFPQGVAIQNIYIENTLFEGWLERNWFYFLGVFWILMIVVLFSIVHIQTKRANRTEKPIVSAE